MPCDEESLSGSKTAMIVVDMQNAFPNDDGSMNKCGMDITELKQTVLPVSNLIIACRTLMSPSSSLNMCRGLTTRTPVSAWSDGPKLKRSTHW